MKRNSNIDLLKTISIVCVIIIHSLPRDIQMLIGRPLFLQHAVPVFMILFGYNRVKSSERKERHSFRDLFHWDNLSSQLKNIFVPYFIVWALFELSYGLAVNKGLTEIVQSFVLGGRGPGGYFIVLMVQAILLFPALYSLFNRYNPIKALTGIFLLNIILEAMSINMNPELYRVFISRHIFSIALGIFLAKRKEILSLKKWITFIGISLIYIISVEYFDVHYFIEHMWDSQHALAYFWTFFLVYIGLSLPIKSFKWVTEIGQSSYYIFLIQKIYFMFRNAFFSNIPYGLDTVISLVISITLGIGFYYLSKNNYFLDDLRKTKLS